MAADNIASVMVTYNPDSDLIQNVKSIACSCVRLIIIDNGSNPDSKQYIKEIEKENNIFIIYNDKNLGLGHALNQGISLILEAEDLNSIEWIATFDQDSKIEKEFFSKILESYESFQDKQKVGILSPNWVEQKIDDVINPETNQSTSLIEQITVITSGSLVKKKILSETGLFAEDFFIDFLDHEFCLRLRSHGYKIYMAPTVSMVHNLGNITRHTLFGSRVMATNHNYIRRYYITRNRIYTYIKYFRKEKEWIKADFIATAKEFIIILLFEKNRIRKLKSMLNGTFDAIRGKKGPGNF